MKNARTYNPPPMKIGPPAQGDCQMSFQEKNFGDHPLGLKPETNEVVPHG